jgi:hypothetical protein
MQSRFCRTLIVAAALTASLALLGVSSALATPKGEYAVFAQCPTSNEALSGCLVSRSESGAITIGNQEVPIVNTQTLQGGTENIAPGVKNLVAALNGETLTKTPQKVPGGILGLVKCNEIKGEGFWEKVERGTCEFFFENKFTAVYATTELAVPATSVIVSLAAAEFETGTALHLPIKVKLENPLLGGECYIGSNAHPITLELTTGKSGTQTGKLEGIESKAEGGILVAKSKLVDGTFTAPEATGCGEFFSFIIDPILNAKLGLPAASGKNTAVLNTTLEIAGIELVRASE